MNPKRDAYIAILKNNISISFHDESQKWFGIVVLNGVKGISCFENNKKTCERVLNEQIEVWIDFKIERDHNLSFLENYFSSSSS